MLVVCGLVALMVAGSMTYPSGAPDKVCDDPAMVPTGHEGYEAIGVINNEKLYTLSTKPVTGSNGLVEVTLTGPTFMGFVMRAFTPGETNLGEFSMVENDVSFNKMNCKNSSNKAVTHTGRVHNETITLLWQDNNNGNYELQATIVQDLSNYVTNIKKIKD